MYDKYDNTLLAHKNTPYLALVIEVVPDEESTHGHTHLLVGPLNASIPTVSLDAKKNFELGQYWRETYSSIRNSYFLLKKSCKN